MTMSNRSATSAVDDRPAKNDPRNLSVRLISDPTPGNPSGHPVHDESKGDFVGVNREAEKAAEDLLKTAWMTAGQEISSCPLPVDPFEIAGRLGLMVSRQPLEPDISGMLAKTPSRDPEVFINSRDSLNRQRFSCAHEIGHYSKRTTGRDDDEWGYIDRRGPAASQGTEPDEIFANQFAAALLMPEHCVCSLSPELGPAALAVRFGVSLDAMRFRLDNLGLS
jgi:Zn-dependent peptidase ImmA (M78 family)